MSVVGLLKLPKVVERRPDTRPYEMTSFSLQMVDRACKSKVCQWIFTKTETHWIIFVIITYLAFTDWVKIVCKIVINFWQRTISVPFYDIVGPHYLRIGKPRFNLSTVGLTSAKYSWPKLKPICEIYFKAV